MKIGIIGFWDRLALPYLQKYERLLNDSNIDYDVLLWDRSKDEKEVVSSGDKDKYICVREKRGMAGKILSFFKWRGQILRYLKTQKYDYLIVLTTHPAVLLSPMLLTKYKGKYIFDIRDYTQEKYRIYQKLVMKLITSSALCAISSKGYLRFLDKNEKITINHNITSMDVVDEKCFDFKKETINFTFVGNVRLDKQTESLMLFMANNPRYNMRFFGRILPSCNIRELADYHNISNISLEGPFSTNDKKNIYADTDLINAVYANSDEDHLALGDSTPIPNRLYDAIVFKCPIVASKGTYLAQLIDEYKIGVAINGFDRESLIEIEKYIDYFDKDTFINGCNLLLKEVIEEDENFESKINKILEDWKY